MADNSSVSAIILAGGSGIRLASELPKQFLDLGGKPILARSIAVFDKLSFIGEIVVVVSEAWLDYSKANIIESYEWNKPVTLVKGGKERSESSYFGVLAASCPYVMIHDGARPFVSADDIEKLYKLMLKEDNAILACPVTDTIKKAGLDLKISHTFDRANLFAAMTPQAFLKKDILNAHIHAKSHDFIGTDDAGTLEFFGLRATIVEGSPANIKITTEKDLLLAEFLLGRLCP